jgi:hypothetical protein
MNAVSPSVQQHQGATQPDCTLDAARYTSSGGWQEQVEAGDVEEDQENQWYI